MEDKNSLTVQDCLDLYEKEGIVGLVDKVKEISRKAGYDEGRIYGQSEGRNDTSLKSYEVGKQNGIKEVVEWQKSYGAGSVKKVSWSGEMKSTRIIQIPEELWQAKLKEWGLDETD